MLKSYAYKYGLNVNHMLISMLKSYAYKYAEMLIICLQVFSSHMINKLMLSVVGTVESWTSI